MDLASDPQWTNGGGLVLDVAWATSDYTNEGSGSDPAPAQPVTFSALDIGNTVTDLGGGSYRSVIDVSGFGFGSMTVGLEGHPNADLLGIGSYSSIPVRSVFVNVSVEPRTPLQARRQVIDMDKCDACHDSGGAGLSFHRTNRTDEMQMCVLCHNPNATDIAQRPSDPSQTPDGKREEAVDMKRMIHQIHMGQDLEEPVVIYGFGGWPHDYSMVNFIGNNMNCLTCHEPGTYSTDDAWATLPTTVDTGADVTDPSDDLNISPVTAVCSSCHDTDRAKEHMVQNGGTFGSFDDEIAIAAPEPRGPALSLVALGTLGLLARRRFRLRVRG
jgi:OmcA/MtrC family decaheme c-type cytochrome